MTRTRGFSLLEILLVLTLMALIMGVAATSLSRNIGSAEIRSAGKAIAAGLRYTRSQAMVRKQPLTFNVDANERTWQAAGRKTVKIPDGMELTLLTARSELTGENAGNIRFFPDGSSSGGRVTISHGDYHWDIGIAWLTGKISIDRAAEVR
ncbi:MAG: GspH/FimT family pseudopilin [Wenzhouxiangellaceae bacterium]